MFVFDIKNVHLLLQPLKNKPFDADYEVNMLLNIRKIKRCFKINVICR